MWFRSLFTGWVPGCSFKWMLSNRTHNGNKQTRAQNGNKQGHKCKQTNKDTKRKQTKTQPNKHTRTHIQTNTKTHTQTNKQKTRKHTEPYSRLTINIKPKKIKYSNILHEFRKAKKNGNINKEKKQKLMTLRV